MAKNSNSKSSSPSRIRFVMVEAELADGDIGQITQAIQNALRAPANPAVKRISVVPQANSGADPEIESESLESEEEEVEENQNNAKPRSPRKPPATPNVVDVDMNADVSLKEFSEGKDVKSQHKKYLVAAAWLKEHRDIAGVTPDHIYTCFRSLGWSTGIPDFGQPLRDLKARKFFSKNDQGEYEINHLGLDYVRKLGGNGAD